MNYVTIRKFAELTGYSEDAVRAKLKNGIWVETQHWRKAPDGRILIRLDAFHHWVEGR